MRYRQSVSCTPISYPHLLPGTRLATIVSPTSCFANILFANVLSRFANVLGQFANFLTLISGLKNEEYICVSLLFVDFQRLFCFLSGNGRQRTGRWRNDRSGTVHGMAFLMAQFMGKIQVYVPFFSEERLTTSRYCH